MITDQEALEFRKSAQEEESAFKVITWVGVTSLALFSILEAKFNAWSLTAPHFIIGDGSAIITGTDKLKYVGD